MGMAMSALATIANHPWKHMAKIDRPRATFRDEFCHTCTSVTCDECQSYSVRCRQKRWTMRLACDSGSRGLFSKGDGTVSAWCSNFAWAIELIDAELLLIVFNLRHSQAPVCYPGHCTHICTEDTEGQRGVNIRALSNPLSHESIKRYSGVEVA